MVVEAAFSGFHREELKNMLSVLRFLGFNLKRYREGI